MFFFVLFCFIILCLQRDRIKERILSNVCVCVCVLADSEMNNCE